MKVKDAMHKGVDWVSPDTPVTELAKLMCEHDIGAIPIGENDRLIGMVTDRDIVCKGLAQDSFDARRATARDVMTPGIHCCRDDDDLAKAVSRNPGEVCYYSARALRMLRGSRLSRSSDRTSDCADETALNGAPKPRRKP